MKALTSSRMRCIPRLMASLLEGNMSSISLSKCSRKALGMSTQTLAKLGFLGFFTTSITLPYL